MSHPLVDGVEHNGLVTHCELVAHNDASELLQRDVQDLITKGNLFKVVNDILVRSALQIRTKADVSKLPDANAVLSAEVPLKKVPACQSDIVHNELVRCKEQVLHNVFCYRRDTCVRILDDELHNVRREAWYLKEDLFRLGPTCEESSVDLERLERD